MYLKVFQNTETALGERYNFYNLKKNTTNESKSVSEH